MSEAHQLRERLELVTQQRDELERALRGLLAARNPAVQLSAGEQLAIRSAEDKLALFGAVK